MGLWLPKRTLNPHSALHSSNMCELLLHGAQGAKGRLARVEQALDALLDAQLTSQQHEPQQDDCSDSNGFPANLQDGYIDSDAADTDSDDSQAVQPLHPQLAARQACDGPGLAVKGKASKHCQDEQPMWESVVDDSNPPSFSQVDLSRPEKEIRTRFPMFPVRVIVAVVLQCQRSMSASWVAAGGSSSEQASVGSIFKLHGIFTLHLEVADAESCRCSKITCQSNAWLW